VNGKVKSCSECKPLAGGLTDVVSGVENYHVIGISVWAVGYDRGLREYDGLIVRQEQGCWPMAMQYHSFSAEALVLLLFSGHRRWNNLIYSWQPGLPQRWLQDGLHIRWSGKLRFTIEGLVGYSLFFSCNRTFFRLISSGIGICIVVLCGNATMNDERMRGTRTIPPH
jgi:hypothetical protein